MLIFFDAQIIMKKYSLLFLFVFLSFSFIHSQDIVVTGQLIGEDIDEFLPYATISVSNDASQSETLQKFATDDKGFFTSKMKPGSYFFHSNMLVRELLYKK